MAEKQEQQKQVIYVFQELYPVVERPVVEGLGGSLFERFYGFQTTGFPDICESHKKIISDPLLLVSHIKGKLYRDKCYLHYYELQNLPINGSDPLTSFKGSFKAYSQQSIILRLPLFEHEFNQVQKEFKKQAKLEISALSR